MVNHLKKLLLVEDALELAQIIIREFDKVGYKIFHADNGNSAIKLHASHKPDLIILDWMLPGLDGLEVLRRIRLTSATPILMLTARDEVVDRVVGLEIGADDYLTKPFDMHELVARVRALLRRSEIVESLLLADRNEPLTTIRQGELILDPQAHLVSINGNAIDLSVTEFNLLHLLVRNPGRTFGRDYLLDTLWGETYYKGDRSVDNTILRLRKKLKSLGDVIETVWGVGYRWQQV